MPTEMSRDPQPTPGERPSRRPTSGRGHIASYGSGRTCIELSCGTSLSRYNDDTLCWRHAEQRARRGN